MEALDGLLNTLKKRVYNSFEEANTQLEEVRKLRDAVVAFEKESLMKIVPATFAKTQQFVASAKNELKKLESDASSMVSKTLDGLYANVKTPLSNATQMQFHNRHAEASQALEKAREGLAALDVAPFNIAEAVKTFVNESRTQIDSLEKKIAEKMMERVIDDKIREAKTYGTKAKDMHFHNRYQDSLDAVAKARDLIIELQSVFGSFQAVVEFLPTFIAQIDDVEKKCGETMYGRLAEDKIREAKTHGTKAKDMHFHNRYQDSLDAIAKARDSIAELSSPPFDTLPVVTTFMPEFLKLIDDIEQKCGESLYSRLLEDKIREAKTHGTKAKDMHFHNRYQDALDAVAKARDIISELKQAPYSTLKMTEEFLSAFEKQIDEVETKCSEAMFSRLADDKIREAKTHGTKAKDMHFHNRYNDSLEAVAKARDIMSELTQEPYVNLEVVRSFLNEFTKLIDDIETKCGESMFSRLADDKIREAKTHGTKAKDMHFHNRYQDALDAVAKARESIAELEQAPWSSLDVVAGFLPDFIKQVDEYENLCGEALFTKVVEEKISAAKTLGTTAKDKHFHNQHQDALDAVSKARDVISELKEAPYGTLKLTQEFLPGFEKQIDEYERQCGEALFTKVVEEKINAAKTFGTTAKDKHFHNQHQDALDAVAKARDIISELKEAPFGSLNATQQFLPEFEKQIDQYERQCGEAMFGRVAEEKIHALKALVTEAENMNFHNRNQEALESVAKARDAAAELEQAPFATLEVTLAYFKTAKPTLDALEGKIGEALFGKVVEEKIRDAKTLMTNVKDLQFHSRNSEALTAIAKTREAIAELDTTPYNTIPAAIVFLRETNSALDDLEAKVGEAMFGRVVFDKINDGKVHINNAKSLAEHSLHEKALETLTKAYDSLNELENPPYNNLPLVKSYVSEARASLSALENTISAAMGSKAAASSGASAAPTAKSAAAANAPGFPTGPIQSTVGPWILHFNSPLTSVQALPTTPAKTRSFIIQYNTNVLTINGHWKKAVSELTRLAKSAETVNVDNIYQPPKDLACRWVVALGEANNLQTQVKELPDDEVKTKMTEQLTLACKQLEENSARNQLIVKFAEVLNKTSVLYSRIMFAKKSPEVNHISSDEFASEWNSLNLKFPYIPPFQEKLDALIKGQAASENIANILEIIERMVQNVKYDTPIHKQENIVNGLKQLEKWPVAHRAAIRRLQKIWNSHFRWFRERWQPEFEPEWPTPTASTDLWQPSEADVGVPEYEMIRPGSPAQSGLPFADRPDSTKDAIISEYTLPLAGKIVFANESIQPAIKNKDALKTKFNLTDPIFARAVWPRSIANYAIGKNKDGTPVYPIDGLMDHGYNAPQLIMSLLLKIDGKPVHSKYAFQDSFGHFSGNKAMYATQQTVGFEILGLPMAPESFYLGWDLMPRLLYGHLLRAGAGTHKVELSLHYNLFDSNPVHQNRKDGPTNIDTLTSHPLAEGSFEVVVPDGAKMPDSFGPVTVEPVPLKELQAYFKEKREQLLWSKQEDDWQIREEATAFLEYNRFTKVMTKTKVPAKWGKAYACLTYKSPEQNPAWKQEAVKYYIVIVIAGPKKNWSSGAEAISVFRQGAQFEADFLPDTLLAKIQNRCEPKFRNI